VNKVQQCFAVKVQVDSFLDVSRSTFTRLTGTVSINSASTICQAVVLAEPVPGTSIYIFWVSSAQPVFRHLAVAAICLSLVSALLLQHTQRMPHSGANTVGTPHQLAVAADKKRLLFTTAHQHAVTHNNEAAAVHHSRGTSIKGGYVCCAATEAIHELAAQYRQTTGIVGLKVQYSSSKGFYLLAPNQHAAGPAAASEKDGVATCSGSRRPPGRTGAVPQLPK
jgi:hypothetical protein